MTDLPDYYALLGVPPDADRDAIRAAYRRLARSHHPDVNPRQGDDVAANEFMCLLNEAYDTLSDDERRAEHDFERARRRSRREVRHSSPRRRASPAPRHVDREPRTAPSDPPTGPGEGEPLEEFELNWWQSYSVTGKALGAQLEPLLTLLRIMAPVFASSVAIVVLFWLYVQLRTEPQSWSLLSYVINAFGGVETLLILAGLLLIGVIALAAWWRSLSRR